MKKKRLVFWKDKHERVLKAFGDPWTIKRAFSKVVGGTEIDRFEYIALQRAERRRHEVSPYNK